MTNHDKEENEELQITPKSQDYIFVPKQQSYGINNNMKLIP
jgi:hypothetical protein